MKIIQMLIIAIFGISFVDAQSQGSRKLRSDISGSFGGGREFLELFKNDKNMDGKISRDELPGDRHQWIKDYDTKKNYAHPGGIFEPKPYMRSAISLFDYIRNRFGYGVEILHDVHERIPPILGLWFAKEVEKYQSYFKLKPGILGVGFTTSQ